MPRDVRSVLEGVRRGGSSSSAGPVHERKRRVRSEWREARGSARIDPRNPGTHERNVCTRERTPTPPTRTHSALGGYAFRDQYPRRRPRRPDPRVSLASSVCDPAYMHTFPSHIYEYFDAPRRATNAHEINRAGECYRDEAVSREYRCIRFAVLRFLVGFCYFNIDERQTWRDIFGPYSYIYFLSSRRMIRTRAHIYSV